jgi:hypothetical protein
LVDRELNAVMAAHAILANRTGDRVHLTDFDGVLRINPDTAQKYREANESFPAHKIATRYQGGAEEGKFSVHGSSSSNSSSSSSSIFERCS